VPSEFESFSKEFIFLLIFVIFLHDLASGGITIFTRQALNAGTEPLNWWVHYFFSGAIGVTIDTPLIAHLILKFRQPLEKLSNSELRWISLSGIY
jgi:hypothetical protein